MKNFLKTNLVKIICSYALMFSVVAVNSRCMCIYHDLDKPEALKKLKKK